MWLLALMILIMPYESSPYLYIAPNFLGVFCAVTFMIADQLSAICPAAVGVDTTTVFEPD